MQKWQVRKDSDNRGRAGRGSARQGRAWQARHGLARPGRAGRGTAGMEKNNKLMYNNNVAMVNYLPD